MATSRYEKITTAEQLVFDVMAHGLSTKLEDILRAQDIFGNTDIGILENLANNVGTKDTRDTFYMILFRIWHWEDATRFWNQHTSFETKQLKKQNEELTLEVKDLKETVETLRDRANTYKEKADRLANDLYEAEKELEQANQALSEAACVDDREEALEKLAEENARKADGYAAEIERLQKILRGHTESLEYANQTILVLKARLYDMMMEED